MRKKTKGLTPEGFRYQTDILQVDEERDLADHIRELPLKQYEFHGFTAKRRVFYYGWQLASLFSPPVHSVFDVRSLPAGSGFRLLLSRARFIGSMDYPERNGNTVFQPWMRCVTQLYFGT